MHDTIIETKGGEKNIMTSIVISEEEYQKCQKIVNEYYKQEKQRKEEEEFQTKFGSWLDTCWTYSYNSQVEKKTNWVFFKIIKPRDHKKGVIIENFYRDSYGNTHISKEGISRIKHHIEENNAKRITKKNFERNLNVLLKEFQTVKIVSTRGKKK